MIRLANADDASQLEILNNEFNGAGETTLQNIKESLLNNKQEIVVVAEDKGQLVGFVCVQLKKSFCYDEYMPEVTEAYVKPDYRKQGIATRMFYFAEEKLKAEIPFHRIELLTGKSNFTARKFYRKLGYKNDDEIHLSKSI